MQISDTFENCKVVNFSKLFIADTCCKAIKILQFNMRNRLERTVKYYDYSRIKEEMFLGNTEYNYVYVWMKSSTLRS